jgi:ectoine hydroxylase-related dioxygenase (phytanoyl-CoA dioxygenase family)
MSEAREREAREFERVLETHGVARAALAPEQREALDERGYVVLPGALSGPELEALRAALEGVLAAGREEPEEGWASAPFALAWTHPRLLAAAWHVLARPFRVLVVGARAPGPGQGRQGLHADWPPREPGRPFETVSALWMLDDFTRENGATRVVPGSHRLPQPPPKSFAAPDRRHPDERQALGRAGSLLVFNGHLWHSGTQNRTRARRRAIQVQLVATRSAPPPAPLAAGAQGLSEAARLLLGA